MSTLSWQAGAASGSFLTGTIIQGLITVNNPNYEPTNWQGTLFVFAMVVVIWCCNIWGAKAFPMLQNLLLCLHVVTFLVIVVVFWALAPRQSAKLVFLELTNDGGWSSMGLSVLIGQITAIFASTCKSRKPGYITLAPLTSTEGADATAHMSEEIEDAGRNVPNAIVGSYVLNAILGFILLIAYLFSIPSVEDALNDPSTYPFIYVFRNALPTSGVNALTILVLILVIASNISFNASTARQTFAFARDNGLPFAKWISHVNPKKQIPANAIALSCIITALLSLINIGSNVAFNAIISLQIVALMLTYFISISCVLHRRLYSPELLPKARWSLGRLGIPVNIAGIMFVMWCFFWSFWPNTTPVDLESFNWSIVLFTGVAALSLIMYWVQGRRVYDGPVVLVEGRGREGGREMGR